VLGCLGVVGVGLLVALIWSALKLVARGSRLGAAGWTLLGVVVAMTVAVPDLSAPLLWTSMSVCLAAGYGRQGQPALEALATTDDARGSSVNPLSNPVAAIAYTPRLRAARTRSGTRLSPILGAAHTRLLPEYRLPTARYRMASRAVSPRRAPAIPKET
jgi:hypothetical protein